MPHSDGNRRLTGFDLSIDSDRDLPGALPDRTPGEAAPDLRIVTLPSLAPAEPAAPQYSWDNRTLTFSAPGVGRYACRRDAIDIAAVPDADPDMVTALLVATALPAVMWLRGETMLHAAGVETPSGGSALAIAGPSGIGKSTLTAQLLDAGGTLLADDSIGLQRRDDRIVGSGLPGGLHLDHEDEGARAFFPVSAEQSARSATIGAVLVLGRTDGAPALVRLDPVPALERLLANQHRPAVPATIGRRAAMLATMAFIAGNCAVYEWHRSQAALGIAERDMLTREGLW
ncbi:hypothetical protein [Sphingomonas bacterium]|uniref:hypothetical protein n=1 Tax=Sphingomonas bacterium TaxID=1895847 RepID=UPI002631B297|nr:hypothetical protein [Sphingomonas bacterium]MDB5678815.1 hypothetical protein [Sphingomonas bacterium]